MTEKRFLSFILTEGILLLALGLAVLMLPKVTTITFGMMLCLALILYGGYKIVNAWLTRNYSRHFALNIINGLLLVASGILLLFAPMFNLILITAVLGVYLILESVSQLAFAIQTRKNLPLWWVNILIAILQIFLGLIIIIGLRATALCIVGILFGINFVFSGLSLITMYITAMYVY